MIERQIEIYERPPRQAAFDGGFASKANVEGQRRRHQETRREGCHVQQETWTGGVGDGEELQGLPAAPQFSRWDRGRHIVSQEVLLA